MVIPSSMKLVLELK
jgi:sulfite exporter TauE/SafE